MLQWRCARARRYDDKRMKQIHKLYFLHDGKLVGRFLPSRSTYPRSMLPGYYGARLEVELLMSLSGEFLCCLEMMNKSQNYFYYNIIFIYSILSFHYLSLLELLSQGM
jgi:hypothetical protein